MHHAETEQAKLNLSTKSKESIEMAELQIDAENKIMNLVNSDNIDAGTFGKR